MKFIGIDGCRSGWIYVQINLQQRWQTGVVAQISQLAALLLQSRLALIDIPIGLLTQRRQERRCDSEARKHLKLRRSSVFPVPCREALLADNYQQASAINYQHTGRRLSKQTWNIMPKIKEIDSFLQTFEGSGKIREMHPELCFWGLNRQQPMRFNKKKQQGFDERLQVVRRYFPQSDTLVKQTLQRFSRKIVLRDDILDALVGALTARHFQHLRSLPENPEIDELGLPMEVVYAQTDTNKIVENEDTAVITTPAGKLSLHALGKQLSHCQWITDNVPEQRPRTDFLQTIVQQVEQYWLDPNTVFVFSRLSQGSTYCNRVWQEMCKIPSGETLTYGELAKKLQSSARAVGNACRRNPLPLLVPCHRVVSAAGIGGYAGQTQGPTLTIKRILLAHEAQHRQ